MQLYLENIHDLICPSKNNLQIREDPKTGVFVENLAAVEVSNASDIVDIVQEGARERYTSSTQMNRASSRSHVILQLTVEQRGLGEHTGEPIKQGVLTVVDLAGSERVSKSHSKGQRLEEAKTINKSISALGNVVAALTDNTGASFVPFRDSRLTRLLTDSLGGNAKTVICANVGPMLAHYDETHSTLLFATRAMRVRNTVKVNLVGGFKVGEKAEKVLRDSMLRGSLDRSGRSAGNSTDRGGEALTSSVTPSADSSPYSSQQSEDGADSQPSYQDLGEEVLRLRAENRALREGGDQGLVFKFTGIIQHLQAEISTQNEAIEGLVSALLAIPLVKGKVEARLEQERSQDRSEACCIFPIRV